jgi:uncharacterized membrane protein
MVALVSGTFDEYAAAQRAVEALRAAGVPAADISLAVRETREVVHSPGDSIRSTTDGITAGGLLGALGGLLVGLGALAIPGLGPLIAAGPLAATLAGGAVGAVTGGLVGAIVDMGIPEEYAATYVGEVERGNTLLTVRTASITEFAARHILTEAGAENLYSSILTPAG